MRLKRIALVGGVVTLGAFASCNPVCERATIRINNFAGAKDVMAEPGANVFKPKPKEEEKPALALEHTVVFKPSSTFKFDENSGLVLYEDGKRNGQVRRGLEIEEKGEIIDRHGKDGFTLLTKGGYEVLFDKSGLRHTIYTPEERRELERPKSR